MDTCLHINLNHFNQSESLKACCATILLYNVSLFTVKKLTISQQTSNVITIFSERIVNDTILEIEPFGIYPISETSNRPQNGIVVIDSHFIQMHSFIARNCWSGLLFTNSSNIQIHNVTISDSYNVGMIAQNSSNIYLSSSHITNNSMSYGIYMHKGYNIIINNTSSMWNEVGIYFKDVNTTQIVNTTASNNMHGGIQVLRTININISNTTLSHNAKYGLVTFLSSIVQVVNTIASNNVINGIHLVESININISNSTISHNLVYGLKLFLSSSIHIDGVTATKNGLQPQYGDTSGGIFIDDGYNIVINNTISMNNPEGIFILVSHEIQVVNTIAANNILKGMYLIGTQNINISNTTLSHNWCWT